MDSVAPQWHLSATQQTVAGLVFGVAFFVGAGYCLWAVRRERTIAPALVFLGAGLIAYGEPFVDVLGHAMFPAENMPMWITSFGRRIPLYMAPVYFFYFGPALVWTMRRITVGVTARRWWLGYGALVALALCFEPLPIHFRWWLYYGDNQPLKLFGLPIWWAFANTAAPFMAGAILEAVLRRGLIQGRSIFLLVPVVPALVVGCHTMLAFPLYSALNSTSSLIVVNLAAGMTIGLSLAGVWIAGALARRTDVPGPGSVGASRVAPVTIPAADTMVTASS